MCRNSLEVTFFLPVLGSFTIRNQDMTTKTGGECERVTSGAKLEEELEDKKVGVDIISLTKYLKCHHLVDGVWDEHLNVADIFLK